MYATALAMRELPARLADVGIKARRHAREQRPQAKLDTDLFGLFEITGRRWPSATHQQIEGQGLIEQVVFVELRCGGHQLSPAPPTQRRKIQAAEQDLPALNRQEAGQRRSQRALAAAARRSLQSRRWPARIFRLRSRSAGGPAERL